jgi:hypothetical protein
MKQIGEEKRKFNRVPFLYNDNILGTFIRRGSKDKFTAHILNFSIQGLYFTLQKEEKLLEESDRLILLEIRGLQKHVFIVNIEMEIRRVLDYEELLHFGYGCYFITFPDSSKEQIRRFLEIWFLEGKAR